MNVSRHRLLSASQRRQPVQQQHQNQPQQQRPSTYIPPLRTAHSSTAKTEHNHVRKETGIKSGDLTISSRYRMNSGYEIPVLGFGVYKTSAAVAESVVLHAFKTGHRHIDSARVYRNEQPCADAIRSITSSHAIPRSEIFFTSKVPPRAMGYDATMKSIQTTLSQTSLSYIDLYLIHSPYGGRTARLGSWDALVTAQKAGLIRSLGVSNYGLHHLRELESHIESLNKNNDNNNKNDDNTNDSQNRSGTEPSSSSSSSGAGGTISVGQWELHPWLPRNDISTWCRERNIVTEAYCPLVRGERADDPTLTAIAHRHGKTWAQVLLRWSLQKGFVPLPKSVTAARIVENAAVFDFSLDQVEMDGLEGGGGAGGITGSRYEPCSWDPTVSYD